MLVKALVNKILKKNFYTSICCCMSLLISFISKPFSSTVRYTTNPSTAARHCRMASQLAKDSTLPLPNSSHRIPRLGFGVYQSPKDVCVRSCTTALQAGYKHIDSAQFYANEQQVGDAVKQSGLPRDEVYLATKILSAAGSVEKSYQKCVESVTKMAGDGGYVDLFMIHSPNAGKEAREEMWNALLKIHSEGKAKAIGVSNFGIGHIEGLKGLGDVWPPHVNQIEVSLKALHEEK